MRAKHWILLACIFFAAAFGIAAAVLKDMGGHKNLAELFTGLAVLLIVPIMFIGIAIIADVLELYD